MFGFKFVHKLNRIYRILFFPLGITYYIHMIIDNIFFRTLSALPHIPLMMCLLFTQINSLKNPEFSTFEKKSESDEENRIQF